MCGRYSGYIPGDDDDEVGEVIRELDRDLRADSEEEDDARPLAHEMKVSGEIFPTNVVPILIARPDSRGVEPMKWGYPGYPDRRKPDVQPRPLINARSETVTERRTWRESIAERRCIVPSAGFYEWQQHVSGGGPKTKYLFRLPDEQALFMAAIYQYFTLDTGEEIGHFSILTTAANDSIADVHDRMPVVLRRDEFGDWLWGDWASCFDRSAILLERQEA